MKRIPHICLMFLILCAVLFVAGLARPTEAHAGGEPRLIGAEAGPFLVSIWSLPNPLVTGEANFILAVADPPDGIVILDAQIELAFTAPDGRTIRTPATHSSATNKLFYEAYLELPEPGEWEATVYIRHAEQVGEADFSFTAALPPRQINWIWIGGIAIALLVVGWFVWQQQQAEDAVTDG